MIFFGVISYIYGLAATLFDTLIMTTGKILGYIGLTILVAFVIFVFPFVRSCNNGFGYQASPASTQKETPTNTFVHLSEVQEASNTVIVGDPPSNGYANGDLYLYPAAGVSYLPVLHGGQVGPFLSGTVTLSDRSGGGNYLYADGHVKYVTNGQAWAHNSMFNVDKTILTGVNG